MTGRAVAEAARAAEDAGLVVNVNSAGNPVGADALAALARAAGALVDVNVAGAALDDASLAALPVLPALTHLSVARNALTASKCEPQTP